MFENLKAKARDYLNRTASPEMQAEKWYMEHPDEKGRQTGEAWMGAILARIMEPEGRDPQHKMRQQNKVAQQAHEWAGNFPVPTYKLGIAEMQTRHTLRVMKPHPSMHALDHWWLVAACQDLESGLGTLWFYTYTEGRQTVDPNTSLLTPDPHFLMEVEDCPNDMRRLPLRFRDYAFTTVQSLLFRPQYNPKQPSFIQRGTGVKP